MGLFDILKKRKEEKEEKDEEGLTPRERRKKERDEKVEKRKQWRIDRINAIRDKFYAVAAKRKWLFFIIAGAIVAYLVIFKGGFGGGDILTKIKGFFG